VTDLVEFLRARFGEDVRIAIAAADRGGPHWPDADGEMWTNQLVHSRRHDPARVLREVEAKREIVKLHGPDRRLENWYWTERKCTECGHLWHRIVPGRPSTEIGPETGCATLRLLALPFAEHPDYQQEWNLNLA
jgi:hypothetical protein